MIAGNRRKTIFKRTNRRLGGTESAIIIPDIRRFPHRRDHARGKPPESQHNQDKERGRKQN
jgi:hypothetical protein